jgi:hypothetical protein
VGIDLAPGLVAPRLGEITLSLRHPKLSSALGRPLLVEQPCGTFPCCPKVDDFRHLNGQRYLDALARLGTGPPIVLNYAHTVALDHAREPLGSGEPSPFRATTARRTPYPKIKRPFSTEVPLLAKKDYPIAM